MSKGTFLLGMGLALVSLALAATDAALKPKPGDAEAIARRIRPSMTLAEVEAIIGARSTFVGEKPPKGCPFTASVPVTGHSSIHIGFGEDHRVADVSIGYAGKSPRRVTPDPTLFDRLRAWLGW
jgi:hypothetical protein